MKQLFTIGFLLFLCACKPKDSVVPELIIELDLQLEGNQLVVFNKVQNAIKYDLHYGDGTEIIGQTDFSKATIGFNSGAKYTYQKDGVYIVTLTAYDLKGKARSVNKTISIDYYARNRPTADYALSQPSNGVVELKNRSKNYQSMMISVIGGGMGYKTETENPVFNFDLNGTYIISLVANGVGQSQRIDTVVVKNIKDRELGYFKGEVFNQEVNIVEGFNNQSVTEYNVAGGSKDNVQLTNSFRLPGNQTLKIYNFNLKPDQMQTNQMKYEQIIANYTVGVKNPQLWAIDLSGVGMARSKSIEILEVKEVAQQKIVPEMDNRAIWVTYKIQADFGPERGIIKGTWKVRYTIY